MAMQRENMKMFVMWEIEYGTDYGVLEYSIKEPLKPNVIRHVLHLNSIPQVHAGDML